MFVSFGLKCPKAQKATYNIEDMDGLEINFFFF